MNPFVRRDAAHEELYRRLQSHGARRRVAFLCEHRMLTCPEALLRLQASGMSRAVALAAIRAQRSLFYVQFIDVAYFPCFQWRHVCLREGVAQVLDVFGCMKTKWQVALWFVDVNDVLDGLRPIDLLDRDPRSVASAAQREVAILSAS